MSHPTRLHYMPPRLRKPGALPEVWSQRDWTTGWLQGAAVGVVYGVALAVLFGWLK